MSLNEQRSIFHSVLEKTRIFPSDATCFGKHCVSHITSHTKEYFPSEFWNIKGVAKPPSSGFLNNYLFGATLGLGCSTWAVSSCGEQGQLFIEVRGLPIAAASPVAEHRLSAHRYWQLWHMGAVLWLVSLSCSTACGIFPDQGWNSRSLQTDSHPLVPGRSLTRESCQENSYDKVWAFQIA